MKLKKKEKRNYSETMHHLFEFIKNRDKRFLERKLQRKKKEDVKAM